MLSYPRMHRNYAFNHIKNISCCDEYPGWVYLYGFKTNVRNKLATQLLQDMGLLSLVDLVANSQLHSLEVSLHVSVRIVGIYCCVVMWLLDIPEININVWYDKDFVARYGFTSAELVRYMPFE